MCKTDCQQCGKCKTPDKIDPKAQNPQIAVPAAPAAIKLEKLSIGLRELALKPEDPEIETPQVKL